MLLKSKSRGNILPLILFITMLMSLMSTTALYFANTSRNISAVDADSYNNMYKAEAILTSIKAGMCSDVSQCLLAAYNDTIEDYSTSSSVQKQAIFKQKFAERLESVYSDATIVSKLYASFNAVNTNGDIPLMYNSSKTQVADFGASISYEVSPKVNEVYEDSLLSYIEIKNVQVIYQAPDTGYQEKIMTDILLMPPNIFNSDVDDSYVNVLSGFSLISDKIIQNSINNVNINGSVFADTISVGAATGSSNVSLKSNLIIAKNGIDVYKSSALKTAPYSGTDFNDSLIIADGISTISGGVMGSGSSTDLTSSIQALDMLGTFYINDDLTLGVKFGDAKLTGKYYGYTTNAAEQSDITQEQDTNGSAIVVNRSDISLDLSGLKQLNLSGTTYLSVGDAFTSGTYPAVMFGDSLISKFTQGAYLVPTECISNGKNPMTKAEYDAGVTVNYGNYTGSVTNLSSYMTATTGNNTTPNFKTVFVRAVDSTNTVSERVYMYYDFKGSTLNAKIDNTSAYMKDYYDSYAGDLTSLAYTFGLGNITINAPNTVKSVGTLMTFDGSNLTISSKSVENDSSFVQNNNKIIGNLAKNYYYSLRPDRQLDASKTMFNNLINTSKFDGYSNGQFIYNTLDSGRSEYKRFGASNNLVVYKGDFDLATNFPISNKFNQGILIVDGNVNINYDFAGLVIASGNITIGTSSKIDCNTASMESPVISILYDSANKYDARQFFEVLAKGADEEEALLNPTSFDSVVFNNWVRE